MEEEYEGFDWSDLLAEIKDLKQQENGLKERIETLEEALDEIAAISETADFWSNEVKRIVRKAK